MIGLATVFHHFVELILDAAFHCPQLLFRRPNTARVQRLKHPLAIGKQQRAPHIKEDKPKLRSIAQF